MGEQIQNKVKRLIPSAQELYNRLILIAGESGSGKTAVLSDLAEDYGTRVINLNIELSFQLLELTEKQRILRLPDLAAGIINEPLVFLDNIEILFDAGLKQDPLRLLQGLSRNHLIIAAWSGKYKNNKLIYAQPDHPEYRVYDPEDTIIAPV
ncbi:NTP hydrolase p-loop-containing [Desulfonema limicola]|uniref:NTP hydrolase p-loop-containing n=1 Tax=Desulfonema limicola TaxID=45656 RepID=A0A975B5P8_9BACT|nr:BREX-3 system P-loop-containing protein BrxF [Desulfonema limicola]QTA79281.1 NTP hydrolase p-loop-containing [Desulfonema limicola]